MITKGIFFPLQCETVIVEWPATIVSFILFDRGSQSPAFIGLGRSMNILHFSLANNAICLRLMCFSCLSEYRPLCHKNRYCCCRFHYRDSILVWTSCPGYMGVIVSHHCRHPQAMPQPWAWNDLRYIQSRRCLPEPTCSLLQCFSYVVRGLDVIAAPVRVSLLNLNSAREQYRLLRHLLDLREA